MKQIRYFTRSPSKVNIDKDKVILLNNENSFPTDGPTVKSSFIKSGSSASVKTDTRKYSVNDCTTDEQACVQFSSDNDVNVLLTRDLNSRVGSTHAIINTTSEDNITIGTCLELGDGVHWFGGPEAWEQPWPVETDQWNYTAYYPKEDDAVAIAVPYWVSSEGTYFYVNPESSLFIGESPEPWNCAKDTDSRIEVAE